MIDPQIESAVAALQRAVRAADADRAKRRAFIDTALDRFMPLVAAGILSEQEAHIRLRRAAENNLLDFSDDEIFGLPLKSSIPVVFVPDAPKPVIEPVPRPIIESVAEPVTEPAIDEPREAPERAMSDELYEHWNVTPWHKPVATGTLIHDIASIVSRYVATLGDRAFVVAAWVAFTWVHDIATHSPMLQIWSPEKDSGKSTLAGLLTFMCKRAFLSTSPSQAVLYRIIDRWKPTFIVDEGDESLANNPELARLYNSGWTKGQGVPRFDARANTVCVFSTFTPRVIALKGRKMPDTTSSRNIPIAMKPKLPHERVEDFDHEDTPELGALRSKLARWAADTADAVMAAKPQPLGGVRNRREANWRMLLAIAELAGPDVDAIVRKAARNIEGKVDAASHATMALSDIRDLFRDRETDKLKSEDIVSALVLLDGRPWPEYKDGQPLTKHQLAALLGDFGIKPKSIRFAGEPDPARGYRLVWFREAFERYLDLDV